LRLVARYQYGEFISVTFAAALFLLRLFVLKDDFFARSIVPRDKQRLCDCDHQTM